ncbi:MAG: amidohydrolase family protein [Opitutales bacterium]
MKKLRDACRILIAAGFLGTCGLAGAGEAGSSGSTVFRGGLVVDGSGGTPRLADVWIEDGRIVAVGDGAEREADREIDVAGMIVAPGFIDTHAHGAPLKTPDFENFLRMGVTTLCIGQDGSSPFSDDLENWRAEIEAAGVAPNIAPFLGHGTIRRRSGIGIAPNPSEEEINRMAAMAEQAMAAGAFGLTTGLEYQPGSFAGIQELATIAKPIAARDGVVMSHVRNEDEGEVLLAVAELLEQGRLAGARVHVSHIKTVYGRGAESAEALLQRLDEARAKGLRVTADLYPYIASYTGIGIVFPPWAKPPFDYEEVVRDQRDALATFLRERVNLRNGPEATLIGTGKWRGKTLAEIAAETGQPFEDVLIDLGPGGASGAYFVMDLAAMERFLVDPNVMICSDGSPTMLHPRGHGSFARILAEYVREKKLLSLEEGIHKMTGLPAATTGLARGDTGSGILPRGRVEAGWAADLVVFNLNEVEDTATFEEPHQLAKGFSYVVVNGQFAIDEGKRSPVFPGKVLRMASGRADRGGGR